LPIEGARTPSKKNDLEMVPEGFAFLTLDEVFYSLVVSPSKSFFDDLIFASFSFLQVLSLSIDYVN